MADDAVTPEGPRPTGHPKFVDALVYSVASIAALWGLVEIALRIDPFIAAWLKHIRLLGVGLVIQGVTALIARPMLRPGRRGVRQALLGALERWRSRLFVRQMLDALERGRHGVYLASWWSASLLVPITIAVAFSVFAPEGPTWTTLWWAATMLLAFASVPVAVLGARWAPETDRTVMSDWTYLAPIVVVGVAGVLVTLGRSASLERADVAQEELRQAGLSFSMESIQSAIYLVSPRSIELFREADVDVADMLTALGKPTPFTEGKTLLAAVMARLDPDELSCPPPYPLPARSPNPSDEGSDSLDQQRGSAETDERINSAQPESANDEEALSSAERERCGRIDAFLDLFKPPESDPEEPSFCEAVSMPVPLDKALRDGAPPRSILSHAISGGHGAIAAKLIERCGPPPVTIDVVPSHDDNPPASEGSSERENRADGHENQVHVRLGFGLEMALRHAADAPDNRFSRTEYDRAIAAINWWRKAVDPPSEVEDSAPGSAMAAAPYEIGLDRSLRTFVGYRVAMSDVSCSVSDVELRLVGDEAKLTRHIFEDTSFWERRQQRRMRSRLDGTEWPEDIAEDPVGHHWEAELQENGPESRQAKLQCRSSSEETEEGEACHISVGNEVRLIADQGEGLSRAYGWGKTVAWEGETVMTTFHYADEGRRAANEERVSYFLFPPDERPTVFSLTDEDPITFEDNWETRWSLSGESWKTQLKLHEPRYDKLELQFSGGTDACLRVSFVGEDKRSEPEMLGTVYLRDEGRIPVGEEGLYRLEVFPLMREALENAQDLSISVGAFLPEDVERLEVDAGPFEGEAGDEDLRFGLVAARWTRVILQPEGEDLDLIVTHEEDPEDYSSTRSGTEVDFVDLPPANGPYEIEVRPFGTPTAFTIEARTIAPPSSVRASLHLNGEPISSALDGGAHRYEMRVSEVGHVTLVLDDLHADLDLTVREGGMLVADSTAGGAAAEEVVFLAEPGRTYDVAVTAVGSASSSYVLRAVSVELPRLAVGQAIDDGEVSDEASDRYILMLARGDDVEITLDGMRADLDLFVYRGNELIESSVTSGNEPDRVRLTGRAAGEYLVEVQPLGTGSRYRLTAERSAP